MLHFTLLASEAAKKGIFNRRKSVRVLLSVGVLSEKQLIRN